MKLVHEYCPRHLLMGTARMKEDKEAEDEDKQKRVIKKIK